MIRVGRISYLNTEPFFHAWPTRLDFSLISGAPRTLALMALAGGVDCAPLPVVECWKLEGVFEPLGPWGIAVSEAAGSVFLFSKMKITDLDKAVIGVTEETSTSVILLDLLLRVRNGLKVVLRRGFQPDDEARLVIGDLALTQRETGLEGFPLAYDLGREWVQWQKRPFVFAQWVVRSSLSKEAKTMLRDAVASSLRKGLAQIPEIAEAWAPTTGISVPVIQEYLKGFSYELGPAEEEAKNLFRGMTEEAKIR